jgi:hypothetical protein
MEGAVKMSLQPSDAEVLAQIENYLQKAGELNYSLQVKLTPPKDCKQPKNAASPVQNPPSTVKKEMVLLKTVDAERYLGKISFQGNGDVVVTPAVKLNTDEQPFESFLVNKTLAKFKFAIHMDKVSKLLKDIVVQNVTSDEQVKELIASCQWCFNKMLENQNVNCPTPQYAPKISELNQRPEQPKTIQATPADSTVKNQSFTLDSVRKSFPEEIEAKLAFEEKGDYITVKPKQFLGSDNFAKIATTVRGLGGEYISAGRDSHFRVPLGGKQ